jgi:hypothetical protein
LQRFRNEADHHHHHPSLVVLSPPNATAHLFDATGFPDVSYSSEKQTGQDESALWDWCFDRFPQERKATKASPTRLELAPFEELRMSFTVDDFFGSPSSE